MISYTAKCPHCGKVIESSDSQADAYIERDDHLLAAHPDLPDSTHDPRYVLPPAKCSDCGHVHTPDGCTGDPTPSDLWAGVTPAVCDCDTRPIPPGSGDTDE